MPYNIQYSPFLAGAFLLGLALVSIVNTSIYAQLYDIFFDFVERVEKHLERIHIEHFRGHGYRIFQEMEPVFRMLVCSFPHIEKAVKDDMLDSIHGSFRLRKKPKKTVRVCAATDKGDCCIFQMDVPDTTTTIHMRKRTISDVAAHGEEPHEKPVMSRRRAPTLGALGGLDLARFR
ncbi:hypothetical protein COOONC_05563 [Cooperia oncophora]